MPINRRISFQAWIHISRSPDRDRGTLNFRSRSSDRWLPRSCAPAHHLAGDMVCQNGIGMLDMISIFMVFLGVNLPLKPNKFVFIVHCYNPSIPFLLVYLTFFLTV